MLDEQQRLLVLKDISDSSAVREIKLIPRERECLCWAAQGKTIEETASILAISSGTVRSYLYRAKLKLGVYKTTQAIGKAVRLKII